MMLELSAFSVPTLFDATRGTCRMNIDTYHFSHIVTPRTTRLPATTLLFKT